MNSISRGERGYFQRIPSFIREFQLTSLPSIQKKRKSIPRRQNGLRRKEMCVCTQKYVCALSVRWQDRSAEGAFYFFFPPFMLRFWSLAERQWCLVMLLNRLSLPSSGGTRSSTTVTRPQSLHCSLVQRYRPACTRHAYKVILSDVTKQAGISSMRVNCVMLDIKPQALTDDEGNSTFFIIYSLFNLVTFNPTYNPGP